MSNTTFSPHVSSPLRPLAESPQRILNEKKPLFLSSAPEPFPSKKPNGVFKTTFVHLTMPNKTFSPVSSPLAELDLPPTHILSDKKPLFPVSRALNPFPSILKPTSRIPKPTSRIIEAPEDLDITFFALDLTQKEFSRQD